MNKLFNFTIGEDGDVAYLKFMQYSGKKIGHQIHINDVISNYNGPDLYLDINVDGEIFGIEILLNDE